MKYIKFTIIISLFLVLFGCGPGGVSSCADDDIKYFDIEEMELKNSLESLVGPVSHTEFEFNFTASKIRYYAKNTLNFNLLDFIVSPAYASCGLNSKEKIHSISISVTPNYFSNQILNGNMELFFDVTRGFDKYGFTTKNLNEIIKEGIYASREFSIRLNKAPEITGLYTFSFKYSHVDGETFEFMIDPIEIVGENDL